MKEKNLYQIRGKAVAANIKDEDIVDKLSILLPPKFLSKNNSDRKKILDKIGLKYLITDIYKNCKCPKKCEPCPLDAPANKGLNYLLDEIKKITKKDDFKTKYEIQEPKKLTQITTMPTITSIVKPERVSKGTQYDTLDLPEDDKDYFYV